MRLLDLPPVYGRLAGFLVGSVARRIEDATPTSLRFATHLATLPARMVGHRLAPVPIKNGVHAGWAGHGADEPPVLIVPGFFGPQFLLWPLAFFLQAHGRQVRLLNTFPALGGVEAHARRVAAAIEALCEETGHAKVDYVAHSMGGLAARWYVRNMGGAARLRKLVTIATPHKGTEWARLRVTRSARDMHPDSPFMETLGTIDDLAGIRVTTIRAGWDQMVWPRESGVWNRETDFELPFAEHWAIQVDPRALALVLAALEAKEDVPVTKTWMGEGLGEAVPTDTTMATPEGQTPPD